MTVWFDQTALRAGGNYNPEIEQYILRTCSCFVAVISKSTERRLEGFFRREWHFALERDRSMHHGRKFIIPVVVDQIDAPEAVPLRFSDINYTWLPGGTVTEGFVGDLRAIVNGSQH